MPSGVYQHKPHTEEVKRKIAKWHIGKLRTEETKRKISEKNKKRYSKFPNLRNQISEKLRREKSYLWKGGISFEPYSIDWTKTLRQSIRERDHYICQLCNKPQQERLHSIHHIDYNKLNCNPDNLITLCVGCNTKVNSNREYWIKYFKG